MQSMHGACGFAEHVGDLDRRQPDYVPEDQDFSLLLGEPPQGMPKVAAALVADLVMFVILDPDVLAGSHPLGSQVIQRGVAGDLQDPGREGHLTRFVLPDHRLRLAA